MLNICNKEGLIFFIEKYNLKTGTYNHIDIGA